MGTWWAVRLSRQKQALARIFAAVVLGVAVYMLVMNISALRL
jgi:hypothetical protein